MRILRRRVAPPAARGDEDLRLFGRRRRVGRPRGDPALGLFQRRRAQQQAAGTAGRRPLPRRFAIGGVLPDPADVGLQRIGEPGKAGIEFGRIVEEDEIQPPQRIGDGAVVGAAADDRREALVEGGRMRDFLRANLRRDGVGRQHEHHRVGAPDQRLDALPPVLEGVDFGAIDQRLESARLERRLEPIDEGHVLARIGDEDLGLRLGPTHPLSISSHRPVPNPQETLANPELARKDFAPARPHAPAPARCGNTVRSRGDNSCRRGTGSCPWRGRPLCPGSASPGSWPADNRPPVHGARRARS